ncbi:MAG: hypothetical protein PT953_05820 [Prevotella sp.]|nr:hypothetical protein [Prevotella sp.]
MSRKNHFINHLNFNQVELIVENEKEGFSKPQVIVIFVFGEQETTHRQRIQKVHRNPIVWRGETLNFSRSASGRLQPHFKEANLSDKYSRDVFPYKVAADLHQGLKELTNDLEEESNVGLLC